MTLAGAVCLSADPEFDIEHAVASECGGSSGGVRLWRAPGVALGCGSWGRHADDGVCAMVADLRIDNRDELVRALDDGGSGSAAKVGQTDAGLLLRAWYRWDDDFLDHVHGDIAC